MKLVVLNACYTEVQAQALLTHVDCVVGIGGSIHDDAARNFAIGFYGGLGERESVATAYQQGRAAISLEGLHDGDRPQLKVRHGVDATQLILAGDPRANTTVERTTAAPSHRSSVDIGILTIRDDEFHAVLSVLPNRAGVFTGSKREYTLRQADAGNGEQYMVAVLRQAEQGGGETLDAARDLIDDLAPKLVLVVGIAGALPSDDVKLGDVVLSTSLHEFTLDASKTGQDTTYAAPAGRLNKALAAVVADLAFKKDDLGDWTSDLPPQPSVSWTRRGQLYGPAVWQRGLRAKLKHHYGESSTPRMPVYVAGPIASSDRLVRDPALLFPWVATARNILAIDMESGGVFRAARERCPMLAIRGISEIVGLKRADAWTKYACASAAAFTRTFLRMRPVPIGLSLMMERPQ